MSTPEHGAERAAVTARPDLRIARAIRRASWRRFPTRAFLGEATRPLATMPSQVEMTRSVSSIRTRFLALAAASYKSSIHERGRGAVGGAFFAT